MSDRGDLDQLPFDRFVEIGLEWFQPDRIGEQVETLHDRLRPLWEVSSGRRGLVLEAGWVLDLITEFSGDLGQRLPFRSRRLAHWHDATYDDLRRLVHALRADGAPEGLHVGVMVVGWGEFVWPADTQIYDFSSAWRERHPELYPRADGSLGMPDLDPRVPLDADAHRYASRPAGIEQGTEFASFLGDQWGALARATGCDVLHLRDACFGPLVYTRVGPNGTTAPDDLAEIRSWTHAVSRLFRACKDAVPDGLMLGYSSGIGAIAERRIGLVDLSQVVADGGIDVWIDQTWGGAWQDWWDHHWKGWTFQVANLLLHRVLIEAGNRRRSPELPPCAHYNLVETWDSWEPWDTLHRTPEKLRWGIWALSHAAVVTDDGPRVADGTYLSWANYRDGRLLSAADVAFLAAQLDAAQRSAAGLQQVGGPVAVLDPARLDELELADPSANHAEWIDDQVGLLMKFAVPILSAGEPHTRHATPDGSITVVPGTDQVITGPALVGGRADILPEPLRVQLGLELTGELREAGFVDGHAARAVDLPAAEVVHLPAHHPVRPVGATVEVLYESTEGPVVTGSDDLVWWQPPDWSAPSQLLLPRSQLGTAAVHVVAARALLDRVAAHGGNHAEPVALHEPVCWHLWRSNDAIRILVGNLESGWLGDSRHARQVIVHLDPGGLGLDPRAPHRLVPDGARDGTAIDGEDWRFVITVPPEGCRVLRLAVDPQEDPTWTG